MLCDNCSKDEAYCTDHDPDTDILCGQLCLKCKRLINMLRNKEWMAQALPYMVKTGRVSLETARELIDKLGYDCVI